MKNAVKGINSELNANYLNAQNIDFMDCDSVSINILGRSPNQLPTPPTQIKFCTIDNSDYGICVSNLSEIIIQLNTITNTDLGIYLSNVTNSQVINNIIQTNTEELQGILLTSCGGIVRGNIISGHTSGIQLGNSSPKLGGNSVYWNKYHGIYVGSGSVPNMLAELAGHPPAMYALSGYNEIYENGGWQEIGGPPDNDGSEIYFYNSSAYMDRGCNSIYDNRLSSPPLINTLLLMNCPSGGKPIYINARGNFWGDTVYTARFGNLFVNYIPYNNEPCPEPDGADELVVRTSSGEIIDTLYSIETELTELTDLELDYAEAEEYFLTGDLTNAAQMYEGIINSNANVEDKYLAYQRKYMIGKLTNEIPEFYNEIGNTFNNLAANTEDSLDKKIFEQLSILSKIGEEEYITAINEFDEIIQQNPNTEEAVYAEIDALTAALLVEGNDSTMQKSSLGKYLVKSSGDYNSKLDGLLRKHFGRNAEETEEEILPTEYTLYQNYPNPFNPTTIIKYDLPNASDVSLIIYDILGRKVKELVNTKQQAGRYEIQFNASSLASGVYIYQLIADKYINSKKMILLK